MMHGQQNIKIRQFRVGSIAILATAISIDSPEQVLWAPGGWGSQTFYTIGTLKWQGCQPYARAAFSPSRRYH